MKIVSTGYTYTAGFDHPETWLKRIDFYTGILDELARRHHVDSIEQINYQGRLEKNGVSYHFLNIRKPKYFFYLRLHRYIKKLAPDVILVNGFIFPLQVIHLRWILGKKTRIIILHRAERPFTGLKRYVQRVAGRYVSAYLFSSKEFKDQWKRNFDTRKIYEVMQASSVFYPVDREMCRQKLGIAGSPVFLWTGRLDSNKDPLTVISAFLLFLQSCPSAVLYMIYQADDLLPEVTQLIRQQNASHAIRLVGKVEHEQLLSWYNSADFIVSGSHYEGGGTAVCEAMSCGCIPVVTSIPSFRSMTALGTCGLLYEPGNDKALLAALLQTRHMDMQQERAKVLQQFRQEYSFEAIARKIEHVIEQVTNKNG